MALIHCPSCEKRISNRSKICPVCQQSIEGDLASIARIRKIKKQTRLLNRSFFCLTLFVTGMFIWFWNGNIPQDLTQPKAWMSIACFVLGFTGYIITRMQLILHKRSKND